MILPGEIKDVKMSSFSSDFQTLLNPLSPNSDQHQFSPNNIHTLARD